MIELAKRRWVRPTVGALGALVMVVALVTAGEFAVGLISTLERAVDNTYLLVMGLGSVAVVLATAALLMSRDSVRVRQMPEVERPTPAPAPGEPLEARLDSWRTSLPVVGRSARQAVRERLRSAAIRTVAAERGVTEGEAAVAVSDGSWTDDPVAAAFLSAESDPGALGTGLRALANGETPVRYRARRTIDAIAESHDRSRGLR